MRAFAILAPLIALIPIEGHAETWSGVPRIANGNTLTFEGQSVRLQDMDAFGATQTCERSSIPYQCGARAAAFLTGLIAGRPVWCFGDRRDRHNRALAHCFAGQTDLGRSMVLAGWAVADHGQEYAAEMTQARSERAGAWAGTFTRPRDWRRQRRLADRASSEASKSP
jgi:endonuclease YncB( thermonuclease family)